MNKPRLTLTTKKIAYIAVLVAINVVLNFFSIDFGFATKLSFTYVPCFIAGIFMGPFAGFLVGAIGDGLGFLITPKGVWLPLITLASGLIGLIPGILCSPKIKLHMLIKIAISLIVEFVVCTAGLNTYAIYLVYG
ncbi:MAG: folate family ECF transporter S component, partial [Clostridia bacterium]|nr:folate family ECF transporter S component [Clostridia bacterium]